ncbi:flagellar biosynthesis protein FlgJ [Legionella pneumophila]|uniref:flagellar biosynthesis protein FlgJ n=1 Tax=Legionella pneumophila TaxID=446 RepID=UPI00280736DE|nr:flagellar biosynthesis protein FlgJ [Legionella pneumophila]HCJ1165058.1 flagellar biosynthesis protein FlgJ [Legionella pneumophila]HCJ4375564.1 flagellar biosynthesis protein FlgJ [Legionella pneumophila]HDO9951357.1 flagellar biosynthesis protein FlgJ [Legionella pneumophila]HDU8290440.1 flagellar biosynthesis protein FlgJ [Legionella pneumophila]
MPFKKFVDMDVTAVEVRLHPKAKDFLFEHYITMRKVFSDVLGQVETDYASIALINQAGQIFFMSSNPAIEQNLIEKSLWLFDGCYQPEFISQDQPKLWSELAHIGCIEAITKYKQTKPGLITGISIPTEYDSYRAIFSFGLKRINPYIQNKSSIHCEKLLAMGKFALRQIQEYLTFPDNKPCITTKPILTLIINNQVPYEHTPR